MKTFFLKHAVAVVAIAIASVSLMSFGLENNNIQQEEWFAVDQNGNIESTPLMTPPSGECQIDLPTETCAVQLPSDHAYDNMDDVPSSARTAGKTN